MLLDRRHGGCYNPTMPTVDGADTPDGVELYDFEDFDKTRSLLYEDTKNALLKQFPKEHNGVRMELADVDYTDPDNYTLGEQKKALQDDSYLSRRLRGAVKLFDTRTGELLDERKMTLMRVPVLTERGTFIKDGNEWGTISQQRLIPGAYSRYQRNGDLETQFNVRPGTGKAFRVNLNPQTGQYKFNIAGSDLHMYSLLKDIGVSDEEMKESWGDDVFNQNAEKYDSRTFEKAYNKIVPEWDRKRNTARTREEKAKLIRDALDRSQIATSVAKRTLPNLFDIAKKASWREQGETFMKMAALSVKDLRLVAAYINHSAGKTIDLNAGKEDLEQQIKKVVVTGFTNGDENLGFVDREDTAAALVRQMKATQTWKGVQNKVNQAYGNSY